MRKQPLPPNCAWKPDESASSHAEKRVKGRMFASRTEKKMDLTSRLKEVFYSCNYNMLSLCLIPAFLRNHVFSRFVVSAN